MSPSIICMGELLIDFVALERDISVGSARQFEKAAGGAPANVAVGLAKLGVPTAFITQVGNDPFGHYLRDTLADNGVDVSMVLLSDQARTMLAFVSVEASGERSFAFYRHPSADMLLRPDQLDSERIQKASIFHYGSISLIDDPLKAATLHAIAMAKQGGAYLSYDPNLREPLWPSLAAAKAGILEGLQLANIVKISESELAFLTENDGLQTPAAMIEAARSLWTADLMLMVVTLGGQGCLAITPSQHWQVAGFSVTVEDTIGAGDGFVAGLLSGFVGSQLPDLLNDDDMTRILQRANAAGALTTTERGGIPALPTHEKLVTFLANQA